MKIRPRALMSGLLFTLIFSISSCQHSRNSTIQPLDKDVREINLTAWQWGYEPSVIKVKENQLIKLTLKSLDVPHSLTCKELNLDLPIPARGEPALTFEFRVHEKGTYFFHSNTPSGPARSRMAFKLYVTR